MPDPREVTREISRTEENKNTRFEFLVFFFNLPIGYCSENNTSCQKLNPFPSSSGRVKRRPKFY